MSDSAHNLSASTLDLAPGVWAPASAMRFQFSRSSGPGGQNVNKLNTKAELWIDPGAIKGLSLSAVQRLRKLAGRRVTGSGEIHLTGDSERGQEANRAAVLARLREMINQARVEPKVRRKTRPSKAAKARRLDNKRKRSDIKSRRRSSDDW